VGIDLGGSVMGPNITRLATHTASTRWRTSQVVLAQAVGKLRHAQSARSLAHASQARVSRLAETHGSPVRWAACARWGQCSNSLCTAAVGVGCAANSSPARRWNAVAAAAVIGRWPTCPTSVQIPNGR
jgi:hypothetical protein